MTSAPRPALLSVAIMLLLALLATGCTGDEDSADRPDSPAAPQSTDGGRAFQIQTRTTIGQVVGRLGRDDRRRLQRTITGVVQRWFNAAYVGGDYPRSDFRDAFPGFAPGARDRARGDLVLLTNKGIGRRIDEVTPTRSRLRLDVLSVRRRAVGVTARFQLEFRTEGDLARRVRVQGRLMLTRQGPGWRVFGYDVTKGGRA
jgi:hypothetical protein